MNYRTATTSTRLVLFCAWSIMLAVSMLPNVIWHELTGSVPTWLKWAKFILLGVLACLSYLLKVLHPLKHYVVILLAIFAAEEAISRLTLSGFWQKWYTTETTPFTLSMLGTQLGRTLVSLLVIGTLTLLGYRRSDYFLVKGKLDADFQPARWIGIKKPEPWTRFGRHASLFISLGLLLFLILGGRPQLSSMLRSVAALPAIILFAAMNAFNEEMTYRASLLAGLEPALGAQQALWITAAFFGIGHYFGVPYGILGVLMATFLGWILGKAMLETRGFFWAWFIHLVQDILIFYFMATGSITVGG